MACVCTCVRIDMSVAWHNLVVTNDTALANINYRINKVELLSLKPTLKSRQATEEIFEPLKTASCAVVGSSFGLVGCKDAGRICSHSMVIHVNDHPGLLRYCNRVEFQFVNAFACILRKGAFVTYSNGVRQCGVSPSRARIRHEWNSRQLDRFAPGAMLSTGLANRLANENLGKCCASAGGVALAFSLKVCKSVTVYGMGGLNRTHFDNPREYMLPVHDMGREIAWIRRLENAGELTVRCQ